MARECRSPIDASLATTGHTADGARGAVAHFDCNQPGAYSYEQAFLAIRQLDLPMGTATHQMTVNGKRDGFVMADVRAVARSAGLKRGRAETLYEEVRAAVVRWRDFAAKAKLGADLAEKLRRAQRLELGR